MQQPPPGGPWYAAPGARAWTSSPSRGDAHAFHRSLSGYAPTPLVTSPTLAEQLGVGRVLVKDESSRFGLPAFKVLGASWACRQVLERQPGAMLVTASDGNHGRAVAHVAGQLGVPATVFLPELVGERTASRIADEGARVQRVDGDHSEAVRRAAAFAEAAPDRALVQDTAWPGYQDVPAWIVEGYATMLHEVDDELDRAPDLVVVPVGVGSLAEAVLTHYRRPSLPVRPAVLAVEPDVAACVLPSLRAGTPVEVATGDTVMAGLNCGTVSSSAWPVLRGGCDAAVTVTDEQALRAVADLGRLGVSSGPSGAATLAGARVALAEPELRASLDLPDDAVVVLLSTEADHS